MDVLSCYVLLVILYSIYFHMRVWPKFCILIYWLYCVNNNSNGNVHTVLRSVLDIKYTMKKKDNLLIWI